MLQWFLLQTSCVRITAEGCFSCIFMKLCLEDILQLHWGVQSTCAHAASLALSLLLPCCQLGPCTTVLGFRNWPGTGEPADNPKPPSPNPGEARGITCTRSPQLLASPWLALSGLDELKVNLCLFIVKEKKVQASRCRPGPSLRPGVLRGGCLPRQPPPLGGLDTSAWHSPACHEHAALEVCAGGRSHTTFLVLFTTRAGDLLPGKIWADLQWQKPC